MRNDRHDTWVGIGRGGWEYTRDRAWSANQPWRSPYGANESWNASSFQDTIYPNDVVKWMYLGISRLERGLSRINDIHHNIEFINRELVEQLNLTVATLRVATFFHP